MSVSILPYGVTRQGRPVHCVAVQRGDMQLRAITYGAAITHLLVPDGMGRPVDVVLGYDTLAGYEQGTCYFGALVGRNANRVADARVRIDGTEYVLTANEGPKQHHGGFVGFDKRVFEAQPLGEWGVRFTYTSSDGEEGWPGEVRVQADYTLGEQGEVRLHYQASTTRPTLVNLTNHSYFNLAGHDAGAPALLAHQARLDADAFTPTGPDSLPTGEVRAVAGTPFDFTRPKPLGQDIGMPDTQLLQARGYDHNFVLRRPGPGLACCAQFESPLSGIGMRVYTTLPGMQMYTGNYLGPEPRGKGGAAYEPMGAVALETQFLPDSLHHPAFGDTVLRPGGRYDHTTVYQFFHK